MVFRLCVVVVVVGGGRWVVVEVCVRLCVECKLFVIDLCGTQNQVWSLVGAAHLPVDIGGVPRCAECVHKSLVNQKGESLLVFYTVNLIANRESIRDVASSSTRQHDDLLTLKMRKRRQVEPSTCRRVLALRVNMVIVLLC